jgi:hypothetical protein
MRVTMGNDKYFLGQIVGIRKVDKAYEIKVDKKKKLPNGVFKNEVETIKVS